MMSLVAVVVVMIIIGHLIGLSIIFALLLLKVISAVFSFSAAGDRLSDGERDGVLCWTDLLLREQLSLWSSVQINCHIHCRCSLHRLRSVSSSPTFSNTID